MKPVLAWNLVVVVHEKYACGTCDLYILAWNLVLVVVVDEKYGA